MTLDFRFQISGFRFLVRCGLMLTAIAGLGADHAAAQTTTPPATAAARLKLIAEEPQPQVTAPAPAPTDTAPSARPAAAPATNDPTAPGPEMRRLMGDETPNAPGPTPSIPDIRLRARVIVHGKPPAALIEIGGGAARQQTPAPDGSPSAPRARSSGHFRTIREGEEFVVAQGDATSPVRVVKLTASEVLLEIVNRKLQIRLD